MSLLMRRSAGLFFVVVSLALLASCGGTDSGDESSSSGRITVLAATSLTDAFRAIEQAFEEANPGIDVTMSFGASSTLATQITNGAPADAFASADESNMAKVSEYLATDASVFATNSLEIMVAPGNPRNVRTLTDLADADLIVVTAEPGVPIRSYTDEILARGGVSVNFRSFEANVGGIVTKITSGAADAGIVYRTDVVAAGSTAQGVRIPADQNVVANYPISVLKSSANRRLADAFVAYVKGPGRSVLASFGFGDG